MHWTQYYDPLGNAALSTLAAAAPIVILLATVAWLGVRIHISALLALLTALVLACFLFHMPILPALAAAGYGVAYGLFPIGWIVLNLMFLYQLTVDSGLFASLREQLARVAPDPRVQVILIAFCFGAFLEGAAGFGTPVAVTAAILMRLGFAPLAACGLSLIANTAPVAFGSLGTPIIALNAVTGLDLHQLSAMVGRQLPVFSVIVPFWVVWALAGFRGMLGVWPVALTAGVTFAVPQFLVANFHGPWLVDTVASVVSMGATAWLLRRWQPRDAWTPPHAPTPSGPIPATAIAPWRAWMPWVLLSTLLFLWGLPAVKQFLNTLSAPQWPVPGLHEVVLRAAPVAPPNAPPEKAVFNFNWLSATGTCIFLCALITGAMLGHGARSLARVYWQTMVKVRWSLLTIAAMLALGYVTKYSGMDATLGLALAHTGSFYPFCGTLLGWLGVALTGSDTASNVLFGGLQKITAEQTGVSPVLMAAANSSGGVMGKMVDAQSIVVASTATQWYGHEGSILRYVFFHSLALAALVGLWVWLQASVPPFTQTVIH